MWVRRGPRQRWIVNQGRMESLSLCDWCLCVCSLSIVVCVCACDGFLLLCEYESLCQDPKYGEQSQSGHLRHFIKYQYRLKYSWSESDSFFTLTWIDHFCLAASRPKKVRVRVPTDPTVQIAYLSDLCFWELHFPSSSLPPSLFPDKPVRFACLVTTLANTSVFNKFSVPEKRLVYFSCDGVIIFGLCDCALHKTV